MDIPEIEHAKYWSVCAYLERTFGADFINQYSNFRIPEEELYRERDSGLLLPKKQQIQR